MVLQPLRQSPANKYVELLWNGILVACPTLLASLILGSSIFTSHSLPAMTAVLVTGLAFFCFVFAVNSSVHSYLIVRYSEGDKVAMNVGFYYCANALGRLSGARGEGGGAWGGLMKVPGGLLQLEHGRVKMEHEQGHGQYKGEAVDQCCNMHT